MTSKRPLVVKDVSARDSQSLTTELPGLTRFWVSSILWVIWFQFTGIWGGASGGTIQNEIPRYFSKNTQWNRERRFQWKIRHDPTWLQKKSSFNVWYAGQYRNTRARLFCFNKDRLKMGWCMFGTEMFHSVESTPKFGTQVRHPSSAPSFRQKSSVLFNVLCRKYGSSTVPKLGFPEFSYSEFKLVSVDGILSHKKLWLYHSKMDSYWNRWRDSLWILDRS